jgi:endonuclease I
MDGCGDMTDSTPLSFEPVNGKGAVARATLYFLVRYPGYITSARMPLTGTELRTKTRVLMISIRFGSNQTVGSV